MARTTYVFQTNPDGTYAEPLHMVEKSERLYPPIGELGSKYSHMIIEDIAPYKSTIDGSVISSRSVHRRHLREHGCVEIGTENMENAEKHFKKPEHDARAVKRAVNEAYERHR